MPSLMLRRKLRLCLDSKRHRRSLKRCDVNTVHQILWTVAFGYIALVPQKGKGSPTQRVQDVQVMIRHQSPSSKATNVLSASSLSICVFFAPDSQEIFMSKSDPWSLKWTTITATFHIKHFLLLLEDPNTKNYRRSGHQTNTMYISPGAGEQTPIRQYPKQIHQANKSIGKNNQKHFC